MGEFFKKAFEDMKESAKAQHEVDKANFQAVKAESRLHFEENRGKNTLRKAKEESKKIWDDAHTSSSERKEKMQKEREEQLQQANARISAANKRYDELKK